MSQRKKRFVTVKINKVISIRNPEKKQRNKWTIVIGWNLKLKVIKIPHIRNGPWTC